MVNAASFIKQKSRQLSYYADAFVWGSLPSDEVDLYCWDTLEEWSYVAANDAQFSASSAMSPLESAFWYLLHQLTYNTIGEIKACPKLRSELDVCIDYLQGEGQFPDFCSGIRP